MPDIPIIRGFDLGDNEQGQEHSRQIQDQINQTQSSADITEWLYGLYTLRTAKYLPMYDIFLMDNGHYIKPWERNIQLLKYKRMSINSPLTYEDMSP